jgi:predicted DNA-binding ribbon-helix-helix protein
MNDDQKDSHKPFITKHSLTIAGHRTSISLETPFWEALKTIAAARNCSLQYLVSLIDNQRQGQNLCSAIRVFVLKEVQAINE